MAESIFDKILDWADRRAQDIETWGTKTGRDVQAAKNLPGKVKAFLGRLPTLWDYAFKGKAILILGPKSSGKSTLISYLLNGKPGQQTPTSGIKEVDRRSELDEQQVLRFAKDIGGDEWSRTFWKDMLLEINPEAVIFMLDCRKSIEEVEKDLSDSINEAFPYYTDKRRALRLVYILMNFSDVWKDDNEKKFHLRPRVDAILAREQMKYVPLHEVKFMIHRVQLNPEATQWEETSISMKQFAADLKDYRVEDQESS